MHCSFFRSHIAYFHMVIFYQRHTTTDLVVFRHLLQAPKISLRDSESWNMNLDVRTNLVPINAWCSIRNNSKREKIFFNPCFITAILVVDKSKRLSQILVLWYSMLMRNWLTLLRGIPSNSAAITPVPLNISWCDITHELVSRLD